MKADRRPGIRPIAEAMAYQWGAAVPDLVTQMETQP